MDAVAKNNYARLFAPNFHGTLKYLLMNFTILFVISFGVIVNAEPCKIRDTMHLHDNLDGPNI